MTTGSDLSIKHLDPKLHGLFSYNIGSIYIESNLTAYKIGRSCRLKIGFTYVDPILDDP